MSLTLFAGCATQMLAALYNYAPQLGAPTAYWYGHPFYEPWSFLSWGLAFLPDRPWIAFLTVVLAGAFVLAAFGVLVIASGFAPIALPSFKPQRGFERWDILRQHGLLGANELALGAVRRLGFAAPNIVSIPRGNVALIGDPVHTDGALIAALSRWQGALVVVDARGLSSKLGHHDIVRFAPGRADGASYNPLLAIRTGAYAWEDARRLASAFLQSSDRGPVNVFALLVLDQLLAAPLEERTFAALRRRLANPQRVLAELCGAWGADHLACNPPHSEMARMAQVCSAHPHATLAALARIDAALGLFAAGDCANATSAHHFRFADLVAGDGPRTLVIAPPPGEATCAAPLIAAMLAQLARECAASADLDHLGRRKNRDLLIVIEAEACRALGAARGSAQGPPPLVPAHASMNGCHALLQARSIDEAARLVGGGVGSFDAVVAIGPQSDSSATALRVSGGAIRCWRRVKQHREAWKPLLLPEWERASRPIVSERDLRGAPAERAYLFVKQVRPIRAWALSGGAGHAHFIDSGALPKFPRDWSAPPIPRPQASARAPQAPTTRTKPIGAQIRKALTRVALPRTSGAKTP